MLDFFPSYNDCPSKGYRVAWLYDDTLVVYFLSVYQSAVGTVVGKGVGVAFKCDDGMVVAHRIERLVDFDVARSGVAANDNAFTFHK